MAPGLQRFLADSTTQNILKNPFAAFEPQQNSDFAARTAAIHVTPDDNAPYDIEQIKMDASWLAEALHIDKVAALRIVVLEWQKQPTTRMLSRSLDDEDSQAPDDLLDISIFAPKSLNAPAGPEQATKSFDSTYSRQLRHIKFAISEASYVLAVSELKIRQFALEREPKKAQTAGTAEGGQKSPQKEQAPAGPVDEVGRSLFEAACPHGDGSRTIVDCVNALRQCLDTLGIHGEHPVNKNKTLEKYWEDLEQFWFRTHMIRLISYLQHIFTIADSSTRIPTADAVLAYFELMQKHDFFIHINDTASSIYARTIAANTNSSRQLKA